MNLASVLIGVLVLAICVGPMIWISIGNKLRDKRLTSRFYENAISRELKIGFHELWRNYQLGIDKKNRQLLYSSAKDNYVQIDLNKVKACNVQESFEQYNSGYKKLSKLSLEFNRKQDKPLSILFYDVEVDFTPDNEYERINKWKELISRLLNTSDEKTPYDEQELILGV